MRGGGGGGRGVTGEGWRGRVLVPCSEPAFMMSSLSSSHLTKTEEEGERGREVERVATSWASLLARAALYMDTELLWSRLS